MRTHALLALLMLSLITFDVSDASFVWKLRKLVGPDPKPKDPNTGNSPSPLPQPQSLPKVQKGNDDKKGVHTTVPPASVPPPPKKDDGGDKGQKEGKGKIEGKFSHSTTTETCEGLNKCTDDGEMLACISKIDSKYLAVLLHNGGDGIIKVKLRTDFENNLGALEVDKQKTEKVNITRTSGKSTQLTLNAGKGDCVLHLVTHTPEGNFVLRLPSYDKFLTPVNGAYFIILMVIIFGGTWACCCACRKKRHDEVPYQELEMALPESVSATNVESGEGWDQGWDDDWEDDVAVKSPAALAGSISANGLTSRSSNKDGWENNWDD